MPEHVDRDRLYTDLAYRFSYVCEFVEFGAEDQKAIRDAAPHLGPLVPTLVNAGNGCDVLCDDRRRPSLSVA